MTSSLLTVALFALVVFLLTAPADGKRFRPKVEWPTAKPANIDVDQLMSHVPQRDAASRSLLQTAVSEYDPIFIPFASANQTATYALANAVTFIFTHLSTTTSAFVLYPYSFTQNATLTSNANANSAYPQGAFIATSAASTPLALPTSTYHASSIFSYVQSQTTISLNQAQAVYDSSIAILMVSGVLPGDPTNTVRTLTDEAPDYCQVLYGSISGKWSQCWQSSAWLHYLATSSSVEATSIVYVTPNDIANGILFGSNSLPRFGSLIFSDLYFGSDQVVIANITGTSGAQTQIQNFVSNGGTIITSGKGALIAQGLGLVTASNGATPLYTVFNDTSEFTTTLSFTKVPTTGCEQESNTVAQTDMDYSKRVLCFSTGNGQAGSIYTALVSSSPVNVQSLAASSLTVISSFSASNGALLTRDINGVGTQVFPTSSPPHILYGRYGQGQIIINLGNPATTSASYPWIYNALLLANTRPIIIESSFAAGVPSIIPALEQVAVTMTLNVMNLYDTPLNTVQYLVWLASGTVILSAPSSCELVTPPSTATAPVSGLNTSTVLDCSPSAHSLSSLQTLTGQFTVFISNVLITQTLSNIVLLHPVVTYTVPTRNNEPETVQLAATVSAYQAAQIVGDQNADPIGVYPLAGAGEIIDNVLAVENKQGTTAFFFQHVAILPLITPLVDISNQAQVAHIMDFDYQYFEQNSNGVANYVYPFAGSPYTATNPAPSDFLDYLLMNVRGNSLAANWDEPVLPTKQARNATFPAYPPNGSPSIANISLGQYSVSNNNQYVVVKQTAFGDAQNYFTYPNPRMNPYLDTSTPNAFNTYNVARSWPTGASGFPSWMMNSAGNALRQQLAFAANTFFFYAPLAGEQTYPMPVGYPNYNTVFSIDRYNDSSNPCSSGTVTGSASVKTVHGYYSSAQANSNPPGLKPNEYSNGILGWCNYAANRANLSQVAQQSNGSSALTHYIVPLLDNAGVNSGDDVMYMMRDPNVANEWYWAASTLSGQARYGDYPELRMKYVYTAAFSLADAISFRGGHIYVQLPANWGWPAGVDPILSEWITWSADEISFTTTTYNAATSTISGKFYRGQMPDENAGAPSQLRVNLEGLVYTGSGSAPTSIGATLSLDSLIYNLGAPPTFETFSAQPSFTQSVIFSRQLSLSLPALRLTFQYNRTPSPATPLTPSSLLNPFAGIKSNVSYVLAYEDDQPFVRYGVYTQELLAHRTVYGSAQINPVSDTGVTTLNAGFSYITYIGESSIPYRQYLTVGSGQLIPSTAVTGGMHWEDLWGRTMLEPLRSLFIDAAPVPGPLRNFEQTTTFELLNPTTNQRYQTWHSDDTLTVRVQVKLLNNYEKWFVLTNSKHNELIFTAGQSYPGTVFVTAADSYTNELVGQIANASNLFLQYGYTNTYGSSLGGGVVWLNGTLMTALQMQEIGNAIYCVSNYTSACNYIGTLPIPSIRPASVTVNPPQTWWNYFSYVDQYWPKGYITNNMWDLTHPNYDDNVFDYGYNYQFDNRLPNIDTQIQKPLNILSYPIFAGTGYTTTYSSSLSHPKFPGYKGWWSDQLQNKDYTLVAGQATSNNVSVGAADLTLSVGWIDIAQLTAVDAASTVALQQQTTAALGNIYTCLFNRKRIVTRANNPYASVPASVMMNNVVPIDPTLTANDPRLTSYACNNNGAQYSPTNISQYNNYLTTSTAENYLYFGANLRSGALEDVNILYTLSPVSGVQQEGQTVVQEGGEFVYWNPSLGPNAFESVEDAVSIVNAVRTDLTITEALYPTPTSTFDATVFQLLTITDPAEMNTAWTQATSDLQYGFGDAAVRTFVGGYDGTSNIVSPGGTTYVEIDFFNNAGFDWNLYAGAINFVGVGSMAINAMELMANVAPVVQAPTAYNFMSVQIPPNLAPYLSIYPSQANAGVAPLQFDFTTINVATIRDGYQGSYYYRIDVSANLPASLLGRVYSIPVSLNMSYFDRLPGYNDPTKIHDYTLSIPNIMIGFPYPVNASSPYSGQAYYTNGYAHNVQFNHELDTAFTPVGAKLVNAYDILALQALSSSGALGPTALTNYWNGLNNSWNTVVPMIVTPISGSLNSVNFNFTAVSPTGQFPIPQAPINGPDTAQIFILVNTFAPQLNPTTNRVTANSILSYQDWMNVTKSSAIGQVLSVTAQGPFLSLSYALTLLDNDLNPLSDQTLHCSDSGIAQVRLTVQNVGTTYAYNVAMFTTVLNTTLLSGYSQPQNFGLDITLTSVGGNAENSNSGNINVNVTTSEVLGEGGIISALFLVHYYPSQVGNNSVCPSSRLFSTGASYSFAFFPTGELTVNETYKGTFAVPVTATPRLVSTLEVDKNSDSSYTIISSPPNVPVSSALAFIDTSKYPTLTSNDWAFAYQWSVNLTVPNQWNNGTFFEHIILGTTFASTTAPNELTVSVPANYDTAMFQATLGISSVITTGFKANTNASAYFIPSLKSNVIEFDAATTSSSSSGLSTGALIAAIVIPIVVVLCCIAAICFICCRSEKNNSKETAADWRAVQLSRFETPQKSAAPIPVAAAPYKLSQPIYEAPLPTLPPTPLSHPLPAAPLPMLPPTPLPPLPANSLPPLPPAPMSPTGNSTFLVSGVVNVPIVDLDNNAIAQRKQANMNASHNIKLARTAVATPLPALPVPPPMPSSRPRVAAPNNADADYADMVRRL